jgi:hypothetical protein
MAMGSAANVSQNVRFIANPRMSRRGGEQPLAAPTDLEL